MGKGKGYEYGVEHRYDDDNEEDEEEGW